MAIKRGTILLPDDNNLIWLRDRMRLTTRLKVMIIQDTIVFIRDLLKHEILILRAGHHHQVLKGIVKIAGIVCVHMG